MNIVDELFEVTAALHAADIHYALCGGLDLADIALLEADDER